MIDDLYNSSALIKGRNDGCQFRNVKKLQQQRNIKHIWKKENTSEEHMHPSKFFCLSGPFLSTYIFVKNVSEIP